MQFKDWVATALVYSLLWSVGGSLPGHSRAKFVRPSKSVLLPITIIIVHIISLFFVSKFKFRPNKLLTLNLCTYRFSEMLRTHCLDKAERPKMINIDKNAIYPDKGLFHIFDSNFENYSSFLRRYIFRRLAFPTCVREIKLNK